MRKIVFLTGGTGSFGRGFISHLLNDPEIKMTRVYSRDEHKQHELRKKFNTDRISFFIGDVRDKDRLLSAMEGSDWIVHAAALKQAPLGEIEAQEFIKTNIIGSENVVNSALKIGAEKAILISTDKAVAPANLYGATKMCAEKIFLQANAMRGTKTTKFACTRYGNVAGTKGSIIPELLALKDDQPAIIHDVRSTRFWMTLDAANKFVLESLKNMEGGEVFIPRLKSVRIVDIIEAIRPNKKMLISRLRNGDKIHEVLSKNYDDGTEYSSDRNNFLTVEEIRNHVFGSDKVAA